MMFSEYKNQIDNIINRYLVEIHDECKSGLMHGMLRYVLVNDSKKLRAILALICSEIVNLKISQIENYLLAIEMIHTYTLVHDDLPSLDNDDFRRGKLTAHKMFNEANGILLGDALQTMAFELFSQENLNFHPSFILKATNEFAKTLGGLKGVIYGQLLDINDNDGVTKNEIEEVHLHKTAVFFGFCASLPMILTNQSEEKIQQFKNFGIQYGMAFQLLDDIDDFAEKQEEANICNVIGLENGKVLYRERKANLNTEFDTMNQFVQSTLKNL